MPDQQPPRVAHSHPDPKGHVGIYLARCPWCGKRLRYTVTPPIKRVQRIACRHCKGELLLIFGRQRMTYDDAIRVETMIKAHTREVALREIGERRERIAAGEVTP